MNLKNIFDQASFFFLCALILLLPFSSAAVEVCSTLAILTWLIHKIIHRQFTFKLSMLNVALCCYILAALISVIFSQFIDTSSRAFVSKLLQGIFTFVVAADVLSDAKRIKTFCNCFIVSVGILIINTGIQWINGQDLFKGYEAMEGYRFRSSFTHPNDFATYLATAVFIVGGLLKSQHEKMKSYMLAVIGLLGVACLYVSFSRAGHVALIVGVLLYWLLKINVNKKAITAGILLSVLIGGITLFAYTHYLNKETSGQVIRSAPWNNSFEKSNQTEQAKKVIKRVKLYQQDPLFDKLNKFSSDRIINWASAFGIAQESPIVGTGLNTYTKKAKEYKDPMQDHELYAHNCFIQMFVELGILGLGAFLFFLWMWFRRMSQALTHHQSPLIIGFMCAMTAYLVTAFLDTPLYTGQLSIYFWLILGAGIALTKIQAAPNT